MLTVIYDGKGENLEKVIDVYLKGGQALCHRCKSPLLIIFGDDLLQSQELQPGIYCSNNYSHVYQRFIYSDKFEEFNRRFNKKDISKSSLS